MTHPAIEVTRREVRALYAPPPELSVSEWANEFRVLAHESSAEPGPWSTARTPYLKGPMDAMTDPHIERVVIMASSQSGKTEAALNAVGRAIHLEPDPMLWIAPTLDMARTTSRDRLAPMIRLCPELAIRVASPRAKNSASTLLTKSFPNGHITLAGANSPASLASRPIRYLFLDEVDRYPPTAGQEGDPIGLALMRTVSYTSRRKIIIVSSPTIEGGSQVEHWYAKSDQRRYWVPCPRCAGRFVPAWSHVVWDDRDSETVRIVCPLCAGRIEDHERHAMVASGEWRASVPMTQTAGFHIWEFFAPWRPLREMVQQFLDGLGSVELQQTFANTVEGRTWRLPGESVEPAALLSRREAYPETLPPGVRVLVATIDTQDDRLETMLTGFGLGEESWILDRSTFLGDPGGPDVWAEFDEFLAQPWTQAGGRTLRPAVVLVDAGGHKTQGVYVAVMQRQRAAIPWVAVFGRAKGNAGQLVSRPAPLKTNAGTVYRRLVDTFQGKVIIYQRLRITANGPEKVHFPMGLGPEFFDELTAERLITRRNRRGVPEKVWEQVRERNESLDLFVYALAGLRTLAPTAAHLGRLLGA